ncbi:ankyrin repeat and zinc finger domain-containing protein 1 isoform X2 [Carcharodon carcharias]|uniref:ankyrin repeat and zinc finger domain-containing protein 1 isoform X2 n=1 Tax=Carcharodon carcharias TaxID=13397 RepID=UPI001B7E11D6|nr:ankyrin repeat and zinc finger domain-containing protein 1 isoform X2 [Carcharodon carcharias]
MLRVCSVFESPGLGPGLRLVAESERPAELGPAEDDVISERQAVPEIADKRYCSACQFNFDNREDQTEHYKLDWHRFNLRQKLLGAQPVSAESFEKIAGEISSISGSDSEHSDSDIEPERLHCHSIRNVLYPVDEDLPAEEKQRGRRGHRVLFQTAEGEYLSVYRCALQGKQDLGEHEDSSLLSSLLSLNPQTIWVILMTGGGHFAGAVFQGNEAVHHKTFHRYTVRAKHGTAQGARDAQNRSRAPRSAGASLRRYNEAALAKGVEDLLMSWSESLRVASAIFLRAASYNRSIFFGGKEPILNRNDSRLRSIPFLTRRATFKEVKRVHALLSTMEIYDCEGEAVNPADLPTALEMVEETLGTLELREFDMSPKKKRKRRKKKVHGEKTMQSGATGISEEEDDEITQTESTEAADPVTGPFSTGERDQEKKQPRNSHVTPGRPSEQENEHYRMMNELYTACKTGDVEHLQELLCDMLLFHNTEHGCSERTDCSNEAAECTMETDQERRSETHRQMGHGKDSKVGAERYTPDRLGTGPPAKEASWPAVVTVPSLCEALNEAGFTLLHVAAAAGQPAILRLLMDAGSDPAIRDKQNRPPYAVSANKGTRNEFRRYMADHPGRYDYKKAQISGPLTSEIESKKTEKKRAQKMAKKLRERELKEQKKRMEEEEIEKKKYSAMSEREKRALAAEKRFAQQLVNDGTLHNIRRCWLCGESLLGRVPFEYLDYTFCTTRCLQEHRKQRRL